MKRFCRQGFKMRRATAFLMPQRSSKNAAILGYARLVPDIAHHTVIITRLSYFIAEPYFR
jgi:hypothetical protein